MSRIKEIEERLSAIAKEAETDGADLEALSKETDELMEERSGIIAREESRKALLEKVANGTYGSECAGNALCPAVGRHDRNADKGQRHQ